jgi:hypothetical protein
LGRVVQSATSVPVKRAEAKALAPYPDVLAVGKPSRDDARPFHGRDSEDLSGELVGLDEVVAEGPNVGGATAIGLSLPSVASQDGDVPAVVDGIGALTGPRAGQCRRSVCSHVDL